jgi:uncharacterized membrane protein YbjE (DUF340 family)
LSILTLSAVLIVGVLLGWTLRKINTLTAINSQLTRISLRALLTAMGAKLALHRALFASDTGIFFAAIGSSAAMTLLFFLVFQAVGPYKRNAEGRNTCSGSPKEPCDIRFKEFLSVAVNVGFIAAGFLSFWLLPERYTGDFNIDASTDWLLRVLLFFIGFDLGVEFHRLDLRRLSLGLLLVPFLNIAFSLAVGLLFGLMSSLGARGGALLTAGMGWYSLSSVMLAERGMMLLSVLAFIHNVFRELLAILCAPLAARLSPLLPVYLGGATSMDVMLPFIQRYSGREYTLVSFYSGIVCSIAVMPLVKILAA